MQKFCSKKYNILYPYKKKLYLNITNRCPIKCSYCIKYKWQWKFRSHYLKLAKEPSFKEIILLLSKYNINKYKEIVFCGYGEPFMRFYLLKKVAQWIKKNYPKTKIRVNTNGLGNVINKQNVCKSLNKIIDTISVSFNAHNETVYSKLHKTKISRPLQKIIGFIKNCKKYVNNVTITTIQHPLIDKEKIKSTAKKLGVNFRNRKYLNQYEPK